MWCNQHVSLYSHASTTCMCIQHSFRPRDVDGIEALRTAPSGRCRKFAEHFNSVSTCVPGWWGCIGSSIDCYGHRRKSVSRRRYSRMQDTVRPGTGHRSTGRSARRTALRFKCISNWFIINHIDAAHAVRAAFEEYNDTFRKHFQHSDTLACNQPRRTM